MIESEEIKAALSGLCPGVLSGALSGICPALSGAFVQDKAGTKDVSRHALSGFVPPEQFSKQHCPGFVSFLFFVLFC